MYQTLTFLHSSFRWLVLVSLVIAIFSALRGVCFQKKFTKAVNALRHWTATIAHIQLMIGVTLYFQSPLIKYFLKNVNGVKESSDFLFFGVIHSVMMLIAIVVVTVGSALTKRKQADREKFNTMLIFYSLALLIILIAIPWPFSPLANRPYFR